MINLDSLIIIAGLLFTAFEVHLTRKGQFIQIAREFQDRYAKLSEDRREFHTYYLDRKIDLKEVKTKRREDYEKIMHWEVRYFWYLFDLWLEGHIRKTVPKYIKRDWDYAIKSSMQKAIHQQAWKYGGIKEQDFWGYREFNRFIDENMKNNK